MVWNDDRCPKPPALALNATTAKWLYPRGAYTLVRRFSAKEEPRRIVAAVLSPESLPATAIGFENHLNVFHARRQGLPADLARDLAAYLNSSLVESWFRQFSGHTQVNATDLRALRYPALRDLVALGTALANALHLDQVTLDQLLERIMQNMTDEIPSPDPIRPLRHIGEAKALLQMLDFPPQPSTMSARLWCCWHCWTSNRTRIGRSPPHPY